MANVLFLKSKFFHPILVLSVARPINAKIIAIIQNLITIVDSAQPFFSKMMVYRSHHKTLFTCKFKRNYLNNY